jgi:hypothetical protein
MADDRPYSARAKLHCIERELKFRNQVYPRRVNEGKMTQMQADREIFLMEEIAADYVTLIHSMERSSEAVDAPRQDVLYRR